MFGKNRNKRVSLRLVSLAGCLILAVACSTLVLSGTATAKKPDKPGGGGGKTNLRLGRIDFTYSPRIRWDGVALCCVDETHPTDPDWEYWDQRDTELTGQNPLVVPEDGIEVSISGGGRLFFYTIGRIDVLTVQPDRWLVLDLSPGVFDDPAPFPGGPDIDTKVYPDTWYAPPIKPDNPETETFIDNVKGTIGLGGMFKKGATRQALDLTIRVCPEGGGWAPAGWSLHSVEDLYIIQDPLDKDVRVLTTDDPSGESNADLFELWQDGVPVGLYSIPLTWTMRMVSSP